MKDVVEAWGRADIRPLFDALDENIVWKSAALAGQGMFRVGGGEFHGREHVIALLSKVSTAYFFSEYETREVVSKGDVVWGHFVARGSYAPVGGSRSPAPIVFETAMRWRVRNGKIVEAQSFFDTAGLLAQQGDLPARAA